MLETLNYNLKKPEPDDVVDVQVINGNMDNIDELMANHFKDSGIHTKALTANKTIYVSPTGSDETGDGSEGKPYRTGNYAKSTLPQNFNGYNVYIYFAKGNYDEVMLLKNYFGGKLYVSSDDSTIKGFDISNISDMYLQKFKIKNKDFGLIMWQSGLYIDNCEFEVTDKSNYYNSAITIQQSRLYGVDIVFNNCNRMAYSASGSNLTIVNASGNGNEYGFKAEGAVLSVINNRAMSRLGDEENQGIMFGGNQIREFKPYLNLEGITTTGKSLYTKIGNLVHVKIKLSVVSINTSANIETFVYIKGLPYATIPTDNNNMLLSAINYMFVGFPIHASYATVAGTDISTVLTDNTSNDSISIKLKHLKVGTTFSIDGFYFTDS